MTPPSQPANPMAYSATCLPQNSNPLPSPSVFKPPCTIADHWQNRLQRAGMEWMVYFGRTEERIREFFFKNVSKNGFSLCSSPFFIFFFFDLYPFFFF